MVNNGDVFALDVDQRQFLEAAQQAAYCLDRNLSPHQVQEKDTLLAEFQARLAQEGVEMRWPDVRAY